MASGLVLLNSCKNIGFEKTKSGLEYKIIKGDGQGAKLQQGDFVKFQIKITYKDSTVFNSYAFMPAYDQVDSVGRFHDFSEFLIKMNVGDSAVSYQYFDTLQKNPQFGIPPYMKKGDKQTMVIKIIGVFKNKAGKTSREWAIEDYTAETNKYRERELSEIKKYLTQKNINATKVNNSVYVSIEKEGTGANADSGKVIGIKYSGSNFQGKFFDSNTDSTKQLSPHGLETFFFVAKQEGAIQGMLEGITAFKQGSVGKIFIPSSMGYGPQGSPPAIKPNENLIFDIEVVEVKDQAPKPQR